jgi:hypothetical protein
MLNISEKEPLGVELVEAIQRGDVAWLRLRLGERPELATAFIRKAGGCGGAGELRSLLHVATDWPGHFPNGPATVAALIEAGADVNARFTGFHTETPLHWAASTDDVAVLDVLLDKGADMEASGGVIGGGTPLADAAAFGQWKAARRLVERGACTTLWQAAALGLMGRVEECFTAAPPSPAEVTNAFWSACHGGQRSSAEFLFARGADVNWVAYDGLTPLDAARRSGAEELVAWLQGLGARSAKEPSDSHQD